MAPELAPDNTLDPEEIERFSRIADEWWDPLGKFRPLHQLNPIRLSYIISDVVKKSIHSVKQDEPGFTRFYADFT